MINKLLPPVEVLWEAYDYNPFTGELIHKRPTNGRRVRSKKAGTPTQDGYICLNLDGRKLRAHRVIWKWMTGEDPGEMLVDHINRTKDDNSWGNLRLVNKSINAINSFRVDNASGVSYHSQSNLWFSRIRTGGKRVHLGFFKDRDDALAAYQDAVALYRK